MKKIFVLALAIVFVGMASSAFAGVINIGPAVNSYEIWTFEDPTGWSASALLTVNNGAGGNVVIGGVGYDEADISLYGEPGVPGTYSYFMLELYPADHVSLPVIFSMTNETGDFFTYSGSFPNAGGTASVTVTDLLNTDWTELGYDPGTYLQSGLAALSGTFTVTSHNPGEATYAGSGDITDGGPTPVPELPANMLVILGVALMGGLLIVRRVNIKV